jgi:hypothetical protein
MAETRISSTSQSLKSPRAAVIAGTLLIGLGDYSSEQSLLIYSWLVKK